MKNRLSVLKYLIVALLLPAISAQAVAEQYQFTVTPFRGGTVAVTDGVNPVPSGAMVEAGTGLTITVTPDLGRSLQKLYINQTDVYPQYQPSGSYTFTINSATAVTPFYDPRQSILTYSYQGAGYVEVWSEQTTSNPAQPAGVQYPQDAELPYASLIHIFPFTYNGGQLQSLKINGQEYVDDQKFLLTGNVQMLVDGDINVVALFSGISNGLQEATTGKVELYPVSGGIQITGSKPSNISIFSVNGTKIFSSVVNPSTVIPVLPGIYTVKTTKDTYKIIVK